MKPPIWLIFLLLVILFSTSVFSGLRLNFGVNLPPFVLQVPRFKLPPIKITATFKPSHHGSSPFAIHFPGISINSHDNDGHWWDPHPEPWPEPEPEPHPEPEAPVFHHDYWARSGLRESYRDHKQYHEGWKSSADGLKLNIHSKSENQYPYLHEGSVPLVTSERKEEQNLGPSAPWDRWMVTDKENPNQIKFRIQQQQNRLEKRSESSRLSANQNHGADIRKIQATKKKIQP